MKALVDFRLRIGLGYRMLLRRARTSSLLSRMRRTAILSIEEVRESIGLYLQLLFLLPKHLNFGNAGCPQIPAGVLAWSVRWRAPSVVRGACGTTVEIPGWRNGPMTISAGDHDAA